MSKKVAMDAKIQATGEWIYCELAEEESSSGIIVASSRQDAQVRKAVVLSIGEIAKEEGVLKEGDIVNIIFNVAVKPDKQHVFVKYGTVIGRDLP